MNKTLRLASFTALVLGSIAATNGCVITDCPDGQADCVQIEGTVIYPGTAETRQAAWSTGQTITIKGDNGMLDVEVGGVADEVSVTFDPSTRRAEGEAEEAKAEMEQDITYNVGSDGGSGVLVQADIHNNSSSFLQVHLHVKLPSNFDGALVVDSDNGFIEVDLSGVTAAGVSVDSSGAGDVSVSGAAGPININADGSDVNLDVAEWALAGNNGTVIGGGPGDITISVPSGANGSIQATSCGDDPVTGPSSPPADWMEAVASEGSKTFSFGATPSDGANLVVTCDGLIGSVIVNAK
jgi:hypothetical protein